MTSLSSVPRWSISQRSSSSPPAAVDQDRLHWGWHVALFLICAALLAIRRLSLLDHPSFYAEDGAIWYTDAYSFGWLRPLLSPSGGYLNTLPRLVAAFALLGPFSVAPLLMNLAGIAVQVLPINALLLKRSSGWGSLPVRALQGFVYFLLPNVAEIHVVITNAHFHLAVLAFLLVVAQPPRTRMGRVLDVVILTISGLTGPFCFALLPVVALVWWLRRTPWTLVALGIQAVSVLAQALELSLGRGRPAVELGASFTRLIHIVGGQVYIGALLGTRMTTHLPYWGLVLVFVAATSLVVYCVVKARLELRLLVAFSAMLLGSALLRPLADPGSRNVWVSLAEGGSPRYWFLPMLAFAWCLVWCATQGHLRVIRWVGIGSLLLMVSGATADWKLPEFQDPHFEASAGRLAAAEQGDLVIVPIFPAGWQIRLDRKGPVCTHPPISGLDVPRPPVQTNGPLTLSGWVAAAEPVRGVTLAVDGAELQTVPLAGTRPDVDQIWPLAANRLKGWAAQLDLSHLAAGPHQLAVRAWEADGCRAEIETFPFTKVTAVR